MRYNLYIIKFTHFKYRGEDFWQSLHLCKQHFNPDIENFHHSGKWPYAAGWISSPTSLRPSPIYLSPLYVGFDSYRSSYKCSHTICTLLSLTSFVQDIFGIHPWCCVYQQVVHFYVWVVPQCMQACSVADSIWLLGTPWTIAHQALLSMGFPSKNTGVGYHFLLQGIFLIQRSNSCLLHLLHWQADSLILEPPGKPMNI